MAGLLEAKVKVIIGVAFAVALIPVFGKMAAIAGALGVLALQGINRELDGLNE